MSAVKDETAKNLEMLVLLCSLQAQTADKLISGGLLPKRIRRQVKKLRKQFVSLKSESEEVKNSFLESRQDDDGEEKTMANGEQTTTTASDRTTEEEGEVVQAKMTKIRKKERVATAQEVQETPQVKRELTQNDDSFGSAKSRTKKKKQKHNSCNI